MEPNPMHPEPTPAPTNPNPGSLPIEIDTGGLSATPEVDYGTMPNEPTPNPEVVPGPEKETPPSPDPGTQPQ